MSDEYSLNLNDFILKNMIGSGSFGKVYKVDSKKTGITYAAKISIKNLEENSNEDKMDLIREVDIISKLDHPSVLKFITFSPINFKKKPKPVIITEYAANGSLEDFILLERRGLISKSNFDDTQKLIILYGIASGMSYLHSHNIIHRDLKPGNILLDEFLFPKISDFGLSKISHQNTESMTMNTIQGIIKGTPIYMSPEIWSKTEYSKASDVYAFAFIAYEIITNEKPFSNDNIFSISIQIIKGNRPKFNKDIPTSYKNLIESCWSKEPKNRPTFDEILNKLKNDRGFITESIDEKKYLEYIHYIEDSQVSFNTTSNNFSFNHIEINEKSNDGSQLLIDLKSKPSIYPIKDYMKLNDKCKQMVIEAEEDPEKQFEIGLNLIKCRNFFPLNTELGIKYLKKSIDGGCKAALKYYIEMLIKGKVIPYNSAKIKKLLRIYIIQDDGLYFLLHAKLKKKKKKYFDAKIDLQNSIKDGNAEAMYEYADLITKEPDLFLFEENDPIKYYQDSISKGFTKAIYKLGKFVCGENIEEGIKLIKEAADQGYCKAQSFISAMLECGDIIPNDEQQANLYLKKSADQGRIEDMSYYCKKFLYEPGSDEKELLYFMKSACDKGDIKSMYFYGNLILKGLYSNVDKNEGVKYIKIAADSGFDDAMALYGYFLAYGYCTEVDKEQAIQYFKKAIEKDNSDAMYYYARMLEEGDGITANIEESIKYFKMAIDKGNTGAMRHYCSILLEKGIPSNKEEAIEYLMTAIDKGDENSMNNYAMMLKEGNEIPLNIEESIKYFKMAIDKGSEDAMINYGIMLSQGEGIPVDKIEAAKYFKMAAEKGCSDAMLYYAQLLLEGDGITTNKIEGMKYLKMAINKGDISAMNYYALQLSEGKIIPLNIEESIKYFKMAIDKGSEDATVNYAIMLYKGDKIPVNKIESAKCFKMAIDKGSAKAMLYYAKMLIEGDRIPSNEIEGVKYLKMAIDKGNNEAMYYYGRLLLEGEKIPINQEEGIKYLKQAIDEGNIESMNYYGLCLFEGEKIPINKEEGVKYMKMSADKGFLEAMYNYAYLLETGDGVEIDKFEAMKYYKMAADKGDDSANRQYEYLNYYLIEEEEEEEEEEEQNKKERIKRTRSLLSLKNFDISEFEVLNEQEKYDIIEAENEDKNSMFSAGYNLIEKGNSFHEKGIKYIEKACRKKNIEAMKYYLKYLLSENDIMNNIKKAVELFNELYAISHISNEKLKFADFLLSKESFNYNDENRNNNINYVLAKNYYKELCELGNAKGMTNYGKLCMKERNNKYGKIKIDKKEAFEYFEQASKKGDAEGIFYYGYFKEFENEITNKNLEEAVKYYKLAYDKGDLNGYAFYGRALIEGIGGIEKDVSEGIRLIKYSCDHQNNNGNTIYGCYLYSGIPGMLTENKELSYRYLKISSDLGNSSGMKNMGLSYRDGEEVEKDINKAIKYFKMGYEEGNSNCAYFLGNLLADGDEEFGIKPNLIVGNKYLKFSADLGNLDAMHDYSYNIFIKRKFTKKNKKRIRKYIKIGLEKEHDDLIFLYGMLLLNGFVFKQDEIKGMEYIKKAADLGNQLANEIYNDMQETINDD